MFNIKNENKFISDCEQYIENNVAAPYIAFYLVRGYELNTLGVSSLMQHFNSAADVFNLEFNDIDKVIFDIKQILAEKYQLKIINENPFELKKL